MSGEEELWRSVLSDGFGVDLIKRRRVLRAVIMDREPLYVYV